MARSSSGQGHRPLKAEITGSNPVRATTYTSGASGRTAYLGGVSKSWIKDLNGPQADEFRDFNKRYGLTRHAAWLTETPMGQAVIALHEGPRSDSFLTSVAA